MNRAEPATTPGLVPGDPVRVRFRKWGGGEHWSADVVWLGEDEHGWWVGWSPGTRWTRPGMEFTSHGRQVGLFPRDRGFAATFYEPVPEYQYRLYVDVATTPTLTAGGLTAVDLDLDVIERFDGEVFVDDEDEFAEHQVAYGYPSEVVVAAEAERDRLLREVADGAAHFREALAEHWRGRLTELTRPGPGSTGPGSTGPCSTGPCSTGPCSTGPGSTEGADPAVDAPGPL